MIKKRENILILIIPIIEGFKDKIFSIHKIGSLKWKCLMFLRAPKNFTSKNFDFSQIQI